MACECGHAAAQSAAERTTVRAALALNATMFVVGLVAGYVADSTGVIADALDMGMMAYSAVSFGVNVYVLARLSKYRKGEVHMRASYICTRADVIANSAVFISGAIVALTKVGAVDLIVGFALGIYVFKEALEIVRAAKEASEPAETA